MDWYIEADPDESWRQVSDLFADWLRANSALPVFGYSEGDALMDAGKFYLCFSVPVRPGDDVLLFETWARTTSRAFGYAARGVVFLNTGERIKLPSWPPSSS